MLEGSKLRAIRENLGLTISDLHELSGVSKSRISDIENNKANPTQDTLEKLANAMDCKVSDFYIN